MSISKTLLLFWVLGSVFSPISAQNQWKKTVPGVVVTHSPQASGKYIGSPSLTRLPNGHYLASHDFFGPESDEHIRATSQIFLSKNKGKSWDRIAVIDGAFWSKLFSLDDQLYFLGTDRHHGHTIIRKSTDGGKTWTDPQDAYTGLLLEGEYHCAPMPVVQHDGRVWRTMESAMGPIQQWGKRYGAMVLSAPIGADLLKAENWQISNVLYYDSTYLEGNFGGWLEGNVVIDPKGEMYNILRVDDKSSLEEKMAMVRVKDGGTQLIFDPKKGFHPFSGGSKKFAIRYDPESNKYWTLANHIPEEVKMANPDKNPARIRNTLALLSSDDLINWDMREIILAHPDVEYHGFQYVDWQFEGKNLVFLSRTAFEDGEGGARNSHDANFLTFHRIKRFRSR